MFNSTTFKNHYHYALEHEFIVEPRNSKKGVFLTIFAWFLVAIVMKLTGETSCDYPFSVVLVWSSALSFLTATIFILTNEKFSDIFLTEETSVLLGHFSRPKRLLFLILRSIFACTGFGWAEKYDGNSGSELFGEETILTTIITASLLKVSISRKEWFVILLNFFFIFTYFFVVKIFLNETIPYMGLVFNFLGALTISVIFVMTSFMVYHDKPYVIAFYQLALSLVTSIVYCWAKGDLDLVIEPIYKVDYKNIVNFFVIGACFFWALYLFFYSFYFTKTIILASLSPFLMIFSYIINLDFDLKSLLLFLSLTFVALYLIRQEHLRSKKESFHQINVFQKAFYKMKSLIMNLEKSESSQELSSEFYDYYKILHCFPTLLSRKMVKEVKISSEGVFYLIEFDDYKLSFFDCSAFGSPSFNLLLSSKKPIIQTIMGLIKNKVPESPILLDINSGPGWFSLNFFKNFSNSTIYACEPIPYLFQYLNKNIEQNSCSEIHSYQLGLGATNGEAEFDFFNDKNEYLKSVVSKSSHLSPSRRLDSILEELDPKKVFHLLKVELRDNEFEFLIDKSENKIQLNKCFKESKPVVIFLMNEFWKKNNEETFLETLELMKDAGYEQIGSPNEGFVILNSPSF